MFAGYVVRARQQDIHFQTGKLKGTLEQFKNAYTFLNENLTPTIFFKLVSVFCAVIVCVEMYISNVLKAMKRVNHFF